MDRRTFLKGLLATSVAPAIVKAENIMRINPRILLPNQDFVVGTGEVRIAPMGRSLIIRGIPEGGSLSFAYTDPDTGHLVREGMTNIRGGIVNAAIDSRVQGAVDIRTHAQGYMYGAYQVVMDRDYGADLSIVLVRDEIFS